MYGYTTVLCFLCGKMNRNASLLLSTRSRSGRRFQESREICCVAFSLHLQRIFETKRTTNENVQFRLKNCRILWPLRLHANEIREAFASLVQCNFRFIRMNCVDTKNSNRRKYLKIITNYCIVYNMT